MDEKIVHLTPEQAIACMKINDGEVHSFMCAPFGLIGADCSLNAIKTLMERATHPDHIQIAGEQAKSMNHAVAIFDTARKQSLFFESIPEKIAAVEALSEASNG